MQQSPYPQQDLSGNIETPRPTYGAEQDHEAERLFDPAPEQMAGQTSLDLDAEPEQPAPRMTYRERRERKAERLRGWADKREAKADAAYASADAIASGIPFGQPILVGHHSESRHRRDIERIDSGMRRSVENSQKADEMRSRADNIERAAKRAIYSDDVDALERLREKLAKLETQREVIKAKNAEFRKTHKAELKALDSPYQRDRAMPFPSYVLQNLGGNISRTRKRLAQLQRAS